MHLPLRQIELKIEIDQISQSILIKEEYNSIIQLNHLVQLQIKEDISMMINQRQMTNLSHSN